MLVAVKVLFIAFFDICRLKRQPQDIPVSNRLAAICLLIYGLLSFLLSVLFESPERAIVSGLLEVGIIMVYPQVLLQLSSKTERWLQTVTALSGTGIVLELVALPTYVLLFSNAEFSSNPDLLSSLGILILLGLTCWSVIIMAYILRYALNITMVSGIILAIFYLWIRLNIIKVVLFAGDTI